MSKIPVIIAAYNEECYIGNTLAALDAATVEPLVVVNGSEDRTAEIARNDFGAKVYELPDPGKVAAIQYGLRRLNHQALGPVLYTDADTLPVFPRHWGPRMVRSLGTELKVMSGLCIAGPDDPLPRRTVTSVLRIANVVDKQITHKDHAFGGNMISRMDDDETLDRVLALDYQGAADDIAIAQAIAGPDANKVCWDPLTLVATSSRFLVSPWQMMRHGKKWARQAAYDDRYMRLAIPAPRKTTQAEIVLPDARAKVEA